MKIKICGCRRIEDVEYMNRYRPDFCGFIFAQSPRRITADTASRLILRLHQSVTPVGVFVNAPVCEVIRTVLSCGIRVIQLHGDEDAAYIKALRRQCNLPIWKAIRIKDRSSLTALTQTDADRYLFDAYSKDAYGGLGHSFDWTLLDGVPAEQIILAGGLNLTNIDKAIDTVHPFMIDLSSGVETAGFKDEAKIRAVLEHIRSIYK